MVYSRVEEGGGEPHVNIHNTPQELLFLPEGIRTNRTKKGRNEFCAPIWGKSSSTVPEINETAFPADSNI